MWASHSTRWCIIVRQVAAGCVQWCQRNVTFALRQLPNLEVYGCKPTLAAYSCKALQRCRRCTACCGGSYPEHAPRPGLSPELYCSAATCTSHCVSRCIYCASVLATTSCCTLPIATQSTKEHQEHVAAKMGAVFQSPYASADRWLLR